ncbi:unnamed protein product [Vitrella brassicaformis CCMP3155]|uniref:Uncharacterized protein n=1 Tax=Vitrella brassicaformis (strain CCMP3155) TaxID=1169540 RepID=A0A0G4GRU5_VITBC|nr:unnamed protein product [Vitrella brassicaformis CCMP3155]|eukprot:CEM33309.1 unnamed protein product [Vitrella brassicaformis CCMP3155]
MTFAVLVRKDLKRTYDMFAGNWGLKPQDEPTAAAAKLKIKMADEYDWLPEVQGARRGATEEGDGSGGAPGQEGGGAKAAIPSSTIGKMIDDLSSKRSEDSRPANTMDLALYQSGQLATLPASRPGEQGGLNQLAIRKQPTAPKPVWHPPWKLMRVISGHQGWVRCLAVDPRNEWFASGSNDRLLKIWDLATGTLKLSLTGHINNIRGLAISTRHPYLFSCGEDNQVKCWDLEQNKVIRSYHGHLSGVYCLAIHPSLDILSTGGRDAVVRVWDMRTKQSIHTLGGHTGTITSLISQNTEPQIISGSMDHHVRLWDLAAGKSSVVLTHHKKSVRAMAMHPGTEYTFASCAADNIKVWKCPEGRFERNIQGHNAIVNTCCVRDGDNGESGILVAGTDNGCLNFWDWKSGYKFQTRQSQVQPGSLESENGIFASVFDQSYSRLITGECDKTIKIWKEDDEATPETHPITWKPNRPY